MSDLRVRLKLSRKEFTLDVNHHATGRGITALFGASGSGKTTMLRCIAGLERAPDGEISFAGERWQDESGGIFKPTHLRGCGYVFQESSLFPHLSVRRNLEYGEKRVPQDQKHFSFDQTVELLGIAPLLARRTDNLSGGERQRVAIARALLASPRLLLMDEPLASLDASRKGEILYYIERLRDELGLPIVYVSHSVDEVMRLADNVIMLAHGKITATGTVGETIGRHAGGSVIDAVVAEQDLGWGLARLSFPGGDLFTADVDALTGERVRVRIAARDVALALSHPVDSSYLNVLPCAVTGIGRDTGASVDVELDAGGTPLIARITRRSAAALGIVAGKQVYALIKAVAVDRQSVGYA